MSRPESHLVDPKQVTVHLNKYLVDQKCKTVDQESQSDKSKWTGRTEFESVDLN